MGLAALALALASAGSAPLDADEPWLVDVAVVAGVDVRHVNGMTGDLYFVEMVGPGVGLVDIDDDGDLDLFLPQGHRLGPDVTLPAGQLEWRDRLLRNDLGTPGREGLHFTDITVASGIEETALGYGIGVATGDVDNDGRVDIYVTNWGKNRLWRNLGRGRFEDITDRAGVGDPGWGSSAVFTDLDGDGWLDLYVANYVEYSYRNHRTCLAPSSAPDYCGPSAYPPAADRLYRNVGGRFEPVPLGVAGSPLGAGLGVVSADLDGDGRLDLYVANDQSENQLWLNQGGWRFIDEALFSGVAVNREGRAEASMGVDAADFDEDGDEDLFISHLSTETNTLYVNDGAGLFEDRSSRSGLGLPSLPLTGFGTAWFDLDGDNHLDLAIANGEVSLIAEQVAAGDPLPLKQPSSLFRNRGDGTYEEVGDRADVSFRRPAASRGLALGDLDNDGDLDLVVTSNGGPVQLFENRAPRRYPRWVGFSVVGGSPPRPRLGAVVEVRFDDGSTLRRRVRTDGSYASARDPRVVVAIPSGRELAAVVVEWPDGSRESFRPQQIDAYATLVKGSGTAP